MKIQYLILCFILFGVLSLPAQAQENYEENYSDYSSSNMPEEWNPENRPYTGEGDYSDFNEGDFDEEDFDMPESPNIERILEIISEIEEVYMELSAELEEYHNKTLKKVTNKLDDCIDSFSEIMSEVEEEVPTNCEDGIKWGLKIFSKAISLLGQRKCSPVSITTRRCIPAEIVDNYVPRLKELYAELEKEVLADDDEDETPDICSYFEEWEEEDYSSMSEEYENNNLQ